jgi:hypothetical protein
LAARGLKGADARNRASVRSRFRLTLASLPFGPEPLNVGSAIAIGAATGAAAFVALFLIVWAALGD